MLTTVPDVTMDSSYNLEIKNVKTHALKDTEPNLELVPSVPMTTVNSVLQMLTLATNVKEDSTYTKILV
jgi:hypothetical protein